MDISENYNYVKHRCPYHGELDFLNARKAKKVRMHVGHFDKSVDGQCRVNQYNAILYWSDRVGKFPTLVKYLKQAQLEYPEVEWHLEVNPEDYILYQ